MRVSNQTRATQIQALTLERMIPVLTTQTCWSSSKWFCQVGIWKAVNTERLVSMGSIHPFRAATQQSLASQGPKDTNCRSTSLKEARNLDMFRHNGLRNYWIGRIVDLGHISQSHSLSHFYFFLSWWFTEMRQVHKHPDKLCCQWINFYSFCLRIRFVTYMYRWIIHVEED